MAITLPRTSSKVDNLDPRLLVLMSNSKTGKTSSVMQLPNSLLIDLEDSSGFYEGVALNLKQESLKSGKGLGSLLLETASVIKEANIAEGKCIYDFIIIDTLTVIEESAKLKATFDYKNTLIGKNFNGKDVTKELSKGAGWAYYNSAFNDLISPFKGLANKCLILLAHAKLSTIDKDSKEIQVNDIELTGKAKINVLSNADAIGYLYRSKKNINQNILSFKTSESDLVCGSRSPHLRNKEFVFSEYNKETNTLVCHWDLVFTSLRNKTTPEMIEVLESDNVVESDSEEFPQ